MQGRESRGKENLEWNMDLAETMNLENLVCQATKSLHNTMTWIQQETFEMPQMQSIDEGAAEGSGEYPS